MLKLNLYHLLKLASTFPSSLVHVASRTFAVHICPELYLEVDLPNQSSGTSPKNIFDRLKRGQKIDIAHLPHNRRFPALNALIYMIKCSDEKERQLFLQNGLLMYFEALVDLVRDFGPQIKAQEYVKCFYRLAIINRQEDGKVIAKIGTSRLVDLSCFIIQRILDEPYGPNFLKNYSIMITSWDNFLKFTDRTNLSVVDTNEKFRQLFTNGFRLIVERISADKSSLKINEMFERENILGIIHFLFVVLKLDLSSRKDVVKFLKFSIFSMKKHFSITADQISIAGNIRTLTKFIDIWKAADLSHLTYDELLQFESSWITFWLQNASHLVARFDVNENEELSIEFAYKFFITGLKYNVLKPLLLRKVKLLEIFINLRHLITKSMRKEVNLLLQKYDVRGTDSGADITREFRSLFLNRASLNRKRLS